MSKISEIRARFERTVSADTSPPTDRGRSPGDSTGAGSNSTSPRPLSKVRTAFVTVERSGQLGLQLGTKKDTGVEPSIAKRRTSFSIDEDDHPETTAERKQSIATEMVARKQSTMIDETIPEVAVMTPNETPDKEENNPLGGKEKVTPAKVEDKKPANGHPHPLNGHANGSSKPTTAKVVEKPAATKTTTKPAPISTAKTTANSKISPNKKSPLPKTPTTPSKHRMRDPSTNTPEKKLEPEKKASRPSLAPSHTARPPSRPHPTTTAHGSAPKNRIPASPPQTGFHKPRPKSPTKPVKLPASLTAHTASSGSKTANPSPPRQSMSRASGNIQSGTTRSPSRATVTSKTGVTRNPSTAKSTTSRPSLGPPPAHSNLKKQASRASLSQPPPADEGFLARMMRPTTASASKTAEKTPLTPPKRSQSVKQPAKRDGPKHDVAKHSGSPVHGVSKVLKETNLPTKPAKAAEHPKVKTTAVPVQNGTKEVAKVPAEASEKLEAAEKFDAPEEVEVPEAKTEAKTEEAKGEELVTEPEVVEAAKEDSADDVDLTPSEEILAPVEQVVEITDTIKEDPLAQKSELEIPEAPKDIPAPAETPANEVSKAEEPVVAAMVEDEDPEDVKAREEIAKLNEEFAKIALSDETESVGA